MDGNLEVKRGRKFDQVVEGAREVFLRDGYEGASVDEIARHAGVSKATLYSYFPDKRLLFLEVATVECQHQSHGIVEALGQDLPAPQMLETVGNGLMAFMMSPSGLNTFRTFVAEANRFPEIGQQFWASGPGRVEAALGAFLARAETRGELSIPDIPLAAHQFVELCKAQICTRLIFGLQADTTETDRRRNVASAVEMFMARYGT